MSQKIASTAANAGNPKAARMAAGATSSDRRQ
jgi:hypothetical protein